MKVRVKKMGSQTAKAETIEDVVYVQLYGNYVKAMYEAAIFRVSDGEVSKEVVPAAEIMGIDDLDGSVSEACAAAFRKMFEG